MKKILFLIILLILFLSASTVNAGLFGPSRFECERYSIEIPEGFSETEGWEMFGPEDDIYLGTGIPEKGETNRYLNIYEVDSFDNVSKKNDDYINRDVIERYNESDLLVEKCQNGENNFTYAEFSKLGHNYVIFISWDGNLEELSLSDDVDLIKDIVYSLEHK